MTKRDALAAAIYTMIDSIEEFETSEWYDPDDPWLLQMNDALAIIKKILEEEGEHIK